MKKANYYFTLFLVLYTTVYSFFNMSLIVKIANNVLKTMFHNLIPSLLPFMILISLSLSLGLMHILSYLLQFILSPLFHLTPMMSSLYFSSFFTGYPTNAKIIKEAYLYHHITLDELQHLLSIASFSSISFVFISLSLVPPYNYVVYLSHIIPNILMAFFYKHKVYYLSFSHIFYHLQTSDVSFVKALRNAITSSLYAFVFIGGYMLVFQVLSLSLSVFIPHPTLYAFIQGILEFSSGSLLLARENQMIIYPLISFLLSFSGLSVMMQIDNILEGIPYSFPRFVLTRLLHAFLSFFICLLVLLYLL